MRNALLLVLASACAGEVAPTESPLTVSAIARGSTWKYWDRGDLGTAWRGSLDDAFWPGGAGPLGYGEPYLATTVAYGPSAADKHITTYFRRAFTVIDPAAVTALRGEVMFDDGIVVYLNGTRIGRASMPSGSYTASTLALGHEAGNAYATYDWSAQRSLLVAGANVIAVEVHQQAPSSSDLVFDLALTVETAEPPPATVDLGGIGRNDAWRYWDQGGDLGTAWRVGTFDDGAYDDSDWPVDEGPLGYGESYHRTTIGYGPSASDKHITAYFRGQFYLSNASVVTSMIGEVMYDDGFVVYLNGTRIGSAAMPAGAITADTEAIGHETGNAYVTFDWTAGRGALVAGWNIVAVEVHQASPSSSDLTFDLALVVAGPEPPPSPANPEDIARGSTWTYWDGGTTPSGTTSGWAEPGYDDTAWAAGAGPLGYGESYVVTPVSYGPDPADKHITTYFRRWFTVDTPTIETTLRGELMYDDGVVVRLNGHEIARQHLPSGAIDGSTWSTGHETGNRYETHDWSAANRWLVPGPNLIAVEVHQTRPTSSDLTFDLALAVDTPAVCELPGCAPAVAPAPAEDLSGVWVGPAAVWAVGAQGAIGRRALAGDRWCWCAPDPEASWTAVWGSGDADVWIVGAGGRVLHHDGQAMAAVDAGTTMTLRDVWGSGPTDVLAVGAQGTVRRFDGEAWSAADLPADQSLLAVWGASADDVWIGASEPAPFPGDSTYDGRTAVIHRWAPATGTWTREADFTMYYGDAGFDGLHGTGPDDVWAVGSYHPAGAAAAYSQAVHFDGASWSRVDQPESIYGDHSFTDVAAAGDQVWITAISGTTVHFDGTSWSEDNDAVSDDMRAIDARGGEVWAVGGGNRIIRWAGAGWVRDR